MEKLTHVNLMTLIKKDTAHQITLADNTELFCLEVHVTYPFQHEMIFNEIRIYAQLNKFRQWYFSGPLFMINKSCKVSLLLIDLSTNHKHFIIYTCSLTCLKVVIS